MKSVTKAIMVLGLLHAPIIATSLPTYEKITLSCQNPGTLQDVAKKPLIVNNTSQSLDASIRIFWSSSDGDKGFLPGPLGIGASTEGTGQPGNVYTCEAFYYAEVVPTKY